MEGLKIVGFVCDSQSRHLETSKIIKILDWSIPVDVPEAQAFIGICMYYQIWIKNFAIIAQPIYFLFRKDIVFI